MLKELMVAVQGVCPDHENITNKLEPHVRLGVVCAYMGILKFAHERNKHEKGF